ncbi:MAG: hypothetical protein ACTSRZ_08260 [Promethearchaeota archaeon]
MNLEKISLWAFKHNFLIHTINKRIFKIKAKRADFPINWKDRDALRIVSIGQSHIDAAWLWRKKDTYTKKITKTFANAIHHMKIFKDRNFTYTQNQAVYYYWVKKYYPQLWEQIIEKIKEGKWEVVDGAWVESDVNIPYIFL